MKQVKRARDTLGQSWETCEQLDGSRNLSGKRGKDVLMVMKMAKSTPVLINGGSFCARNLLSGTLGISSSNPFHDFDSRFRLRAQRVSFRITVYISGGCINEFNIFLELVYAYKCM